MNHIVVWADETGEVSHLKFAEEEQAHEWLDNHAEHAVLINLETGDVEDYV